MPSALGLPFLTEGMPEDWVDSAVPLRVRFRLGVPSLVVAGEEGGLIDFLPVVKPGFPRGGSSSLSGAVLIGSSTSVFITSGAGGNSSRGEPGFRRWAGEWNGVTVSEGTGLSTSLKYVRPLRVRGGPLGRLKGLGRSPGDISPSCVCVVIRRCKIVRRCSPGGLRFPESLTREGGLTTDPPVTTSARWRVPAPRGWKNIPAGCPSGLWITRPELGDAPSFSAASEKYSKLSDSRRGDGGRR